MENQKDITSEEFVEEMLTLVGLYNYEINNISSAIKFLGLLSIIPIISLIVFSDTPVFYVFLSALFILIVFILLANIYSKKCHKEKVIVIELMEELVPNWEELAPDWKGWESLPEEEE